MPRRSWAVGFGDDDKTRTSFSGLSQPYPSSRIGYVLLKNSPHTYRYQNVLHVSKGRFIPSYQGSDHNLQLATIGIGQPK